MNRRDHLIDMITHLLQSKAAADRELTGSQRTWHFPRLGAAVDLARELFPEEFEVAAKAAGV